MGNYAFYGKIYRRKAELGEGFGSDCLNGNLGDWGFLGLEVLFLSESRIFGELPCQIYG